MKSKVSILIIGDDPPLQQSLALVFRQVGYTAISTALNLNVLGILAKYSFDLIVLDINQTYDSSLTMFFKIKKNYPLLPIILLSHNPETDPIPCFEEEKAWMIIRKPFEPGFLLQSIHAITSAALISNALPLAMSN